jgi:hypothetical protein
MTLRQQSIDRRLSKNEFTLLGPRRIGMVTQIYGILQDRGREEKRWSTFLDNVAWNRVKWVGALDHATAKIGQLTEGICVADPKTGRLLEVCIPKSARIDPSSIAT